jgi:hypothetical protein
MKLKDRHLIEFLHVKGLKVDEIATELSNIYGRDVYSPPNIKYWRY